MKDILAEITIPLLWTGFAIFMALGIWYHIAEAVRMYRLERHWKSRLERKKGETNGPKEDN